MWDSSGVRRLTICESTDDDATLDTDDTTSASCPGRCDTISRFVLSGCSSETDTDSAADCGDATDTDEGLISVTLQLVSTEQCRFCRFCSTFSILRFFSSISVHKWNHTETTATGMNYNNFKFHDHVITILSAHVTEKGQSRDPNMLKAQYLENVCRYRLSDNGPRIGNGHLGIKWSCEWWRHLTQKGQDRDLQYVWCPLSRK